MVTCFNTHRGPGTVLSTSHVETPQFFTTHGVEMRKLRHRAAKEADQATQLVRTQAGPSPGRLAPELLLCTASDSPHMRCCGEKQGSCPCWPVISTRAESQSSQPPAFLLHPLNLTCWPQGSHAPGGSAWQMSLWPSRLAS